MADATSAAAPVARDDFDAALIAGFREATRAEYDDLDRAWGQGASVALGPDGEFRAGLARQRDCPLCGAPASGAALRFTKLGMRILSCQGCGMTYSREVLRPELDRELYLSSVAQTSYRRLKANEKYATLERLKSLYIVQQLRRFRAPPGHLLDIGPGAGRLLAAAASDGWAARGVEASPEFAEACRADGLRVETGFFPDCLGHGARFDVVTALDLLEHAEQPLEFLASLRGCLVPGGVAVLQVPNFASLLVRAEGARNTNFCHGHWNHFDAATLGRIAKRAHFAVLHVETIISELDRIRALPAAVVDATVRELSGHGTPDGGLTARWLHAQQFGYKLLGYFRRPESGG